MLSEEEIHKIAKLSYLSLTPEEVKKFQKELSGILSFFEEISEINTDGVIPTAQITGLTDMLRLDNPVQNISADALLKSSQHCIRDHQVCVPAIL